MSFHLGNKIKGVYLSGSEIARAYFGSNLVYQNKVTAPANALTFVNPASNGVTNFVITVDQYANDKVFYYELTEDDASVMAKIEYTKGDSFILEIDPGTTLKLWSTDKLPCAGGFRIICPGTLISGSMTSLFNQEKDLTKVGGYAMAKLIHEYCGIADFSAVTLDFTQMAGYDCYQMFYDNDALTKAPLLPCTNMEKGCYQEMFSECRCLTTAPPVLPALKLNYCDVGGVGCYEKMFFSCDNLVTAPELMFTEITDDDSAYDSVWDMYATLEDANGEHSALMNMFSYCNELNELTIHYPYPLMDDSWNSPAQGWLNQVASKGILHVPEGWKDTDEFASAYEADTLYQPSSVPDGWCIKTGSEKSAPDNALTLEVDGLSGNYYLVVDHLGNLYPDKTLWCQMDGCEAYQITDGGEAAGGVETSDGSGNFTSVETQAGFVKNGNYFIPLYGSGGYTGTSAGHSRAKKVQIWSEDSKPLNATDASTYVSLHIGKCIPDSNIFPTTATSPSGVTVKVSGSLESLFPEAEGLLEADAYKNLLREFLKELPVTEVNDLIYPFSIVPEYGLSSFYGGSLNAPASVALKFSASSVEVRDHGLSMCLGNGTTTVSAVIPDLSSITKIYPYALNSFALSPNISGEVKFGTSVAVANNSDAPGYHLYNAFAGTGVSSADLSGFPTEISDAPYVFANAFKNCTALASAKLPTSLTFVSSKQAMSSMFYGCSALLRAPKTTVSLAECEYGLTATFRGCTGMTYANEFRISSLSGTLKYVCSSMFLGCTSLIQMPDMLNLNIVNLSSGMRSFAGMFAGCSSLASLEIGFASFSKASDSVSSALMGMMFMNMLNGCTSLRSIYWNGDFGTFDESTGVSSDTDTAITGSLPDDGSGETCNLDLVHFLAWGCLDANEELEPEFGIIRAKNVPTDYDTQLSTLYTNTSYAMVTGYYGLPLDPTYWTVFEIPEAPTSCVEIKNTSDKEVFIGLGTHDLDNNFTAQKNAYQAAISANTYNYYTKPYYYIDDNNNIRPLLLTPIANPSTDISTNVETAKADPIGKIILGAGKTLKMFAGGNAYTAHNAQSFTFLTAKSASTTACLEVDGGWRSMDIDATDTDFRNWSFVGFFAYNTLIKKVNNIYDGITYYNTYQCGSFNKFLYHCTGLEECYVPDVFVATSDKNYVMAHYFASGCTALKTVHMLVSAVYMGGTAVTQSASKCYPWYNAFAGCTALEKVTFENTTGVAVTATTNILRSYSSIMPKYSYMENFGYAFVTEEEGTTNLTQTIDFEVYESATSSTSYMQMSACSRDATAPTVPSNATFTKHTF